MSHHPRSHTARNPNPPKGNVEARHPRRTPHQHTFTLTPFLPLHHNAQHHLPIDRMVITLPHLHQKHARRGSPWTKIHKDSIANSSTNSRGWFELKAALNHLARAKLPLSPFTPQNLPPRHQHPFTNTSSSSPPSDTMSTDTTKAKSMSKGAKKSRVVILHLSTDQLAKFPSSNTESPSPSAIKEEQSPSVQPSDHADTKSPTSNSTPLPPGANGDVEPDSTAPAKSDNKRKRGGGTLTGRKRAPPSINPDAPPRDRARPGPKRKSGV